MKIGMPVIVEKFLPVPSGNIHGPQAIFYILFSWPFSFEFPFQKA